MSYQDPLLLLYSRLLHITIAFQSSCLNTFVAPFSIQIINVCFYQKTGQTLRTYVISTFSTFITAPFIKVKVKSAFGAHPGFCSMELLGLFLLPPG